MASWKVTFSQVVNANVMRQKLLDSKFYVRSGEPKEVIVQEDTVILVVPADKDRQAMMKTCAQTFKSYGTFAQYTVDAVDSSGASSSGMSSGLDDSYFQYIPISSIFWNSGIPEFWNVCV